jgi:PAS domain S-box-containing protein
MTARDEMLQQDGFRLLVGSVKDFGMFLLDTQGRIASWNPGAEQIFGYAETEILGQHFSVLFTPEDRQDGEPERELREAMEEGKAADKRWHLKKDGQRFWADGVVRTVHNDKGETIGFAKVLHDIGERKELETSLMQQVEKMAASSQQKDEFVVLLAHELRNPLAPILNALHIISQEKTGDPTQQQARGIIERQVRSLARFADDLLEMYHLQRGMVTLHKERINLSNVMRRALEAKHSLIEERQQNLSVLFPDQPLWLEADPARLEQALANLLSNASRFTDVGGGIWLSGEREGESALLRVRDAGVGIEPAMLATIFDPFSPARSGVDRSECGLGIGLAIVKQIVELHGGTVEARSDGLHMGSEFILRIPLPGQRKTTRPERIVKSGARNGVKVLVVEDNVDAAHSLAMVLGLGGYQVSVQHTGLKGLETALADKPHVAIVDIGLPELDGWQIARRLRNQLGEKRPVLIALSGYGDEEDRKKSTQAGFNHHLTKPVSPDELLALLKDTVSLPETANGPLSTPA